MKSATATHHYYKCYLYIPCCHFDDRYIRYSHLEMELSPRRCMYSHCVGILLLHLKMKIEKKNELKLSIWKDCSIIRNKDTRGMVDESVLFLFRQMTSRDFCFKSNHTFLSLNIVISSRL